MLGQGAVTAAALPRRLRSALAALCFVVAGIGFFFAMTVFVFAGAWAPSTALLPCLCLAAMALSFHLRRGRGRPGAALDPCAPIASDKG